MRPIPALAIAASILCAAVGAFGAGEFPILNGRLQNDLAAGTNALTEVRRIWLIDHLNNVARELLISNGVFFVNGINGYAPLSAESDTLASVLSRGATITNDVEIVLANPNFSLSVSVENTNGAFVVTTINADGLSVGSGGGLSGNGYGLTMLNAEKLVNDVPLARIPHENLLSGSTSAVPTSAAVVGGRIVEAASSTATVAVAWSDSLTHYISSAPGNKAYTLPTTDGTLRGAKYRFTVATTNLLFVVPSANAYIDSGGYGAFTYSGAGGTNAYPFASVEVGLIGSNHWLLLDGRREWSTTLFP